MTRIGEILIHDGQWGMVVQKTHRDPLSLPLGRAVDILWEDGQSLRHLEDETQGFPSIGKPRQIKRRKAQESTFYRFEARQFEPHRELQLVIDVPNHTPMTPNKLLVAAWTRHVNHRRPRKEPHATEPRT